MTEQRRSDRLGRALEMLVYAPLGLGSYLRDSLPDAVETLVARGRSEVDHQQEEVTRRITTVRSTGQVAWHFGLPQLLRGWRSRTEERVTQARERVGSLSAGVAGAGLAGAAGVRERVGGVRRVAEGLIAPVTGRSNGAAVHRAATEQRAATEHRAAPGSPVVAGSVRPQAGDSAHLPIPGYDALSASQVVEHLAGLTDVELAAVGEYETAHRNRRTILGKIDQLAAPPGPPDPAGAPSPSAPPES